MIFQLLAILVFNSVFCMALSWWFPRGPQQEVVDTISSAPAMAKLGLIFWVTILGPIFEEYLFRGLLLRSLAWIFGFFNVNCNVLAIISSALIFAWMHFQPYNFPFLMVIGLWLGWLYVKTGYKLTAPICLHILNNTYAVAVTFLW